jgi:hypothetical protein
MAGDAAEAGAASARFILQDVASCPDEICTGQTNVTTSDHVRVDAICCENESMGDKGCEHIQKTPEKQTDAPQGAAKSGAIPFAHGMALPADLRALIDCWGRLPADVRSAILAISRLSK